jgi:hypothetical protein
VKVVWRNAADTGQAVLTLLWYFLVGPLVTWAVGVLLLLWVAGVL